MNNNNQDPGSLTASEYEEIYNLLLTYKSIIDKVDEASYIKEVRKSKIQLIDRLTSKMKARMEQFPNNFV